MSIPVINFPPFRPYSNITPFTVRDGATYLTVLEELRNWLNTTLVPHVDTEIANLVIAWEDNASTLLANVIAALNDQSDTVTAQLNEQNASILQQLNAQNAAITAQLAAQDANVAAQIDAMTTYVDNAVQSIINSTIEVSDPVISGVISNNTSESYADIVNIISDFTTAQKGIANGIAELDGTARLPESQVPDRLTEAQIGISFRRGRSVLEYGAVGGNAALDTAAFQAAISAADGVVFVPKSPSGLRYVINATLTVPQSGTSRSIIGLGNGMVEIEYTGTGYMVESISANPADPASAPTDLFFENLSIDGYENTTSDGAFLIDGAYFVNFDRVEVRRFSKAGAVGMKLLNSFNIDVFRSNVMMITNGIGIEVGGSLQQVTNFHLHDFVIQRSGVGLAITTGIGGGGLQVDNGAIRAENDQVGVQVTGKYNDVQFGPALHIESGSAVGVNTTKGIEFSGAGLFASQVIFDGIDFYNVKTLFDLDGSAGTLLGVKIDHIYASGMSGLAGTGFILNNIPRGFRVGSYQINSSEYPTIWNVTNVELADPIIFGPSDVYSVVGSPSISSINRWPVWLLDSATSEAVGVTFRPPRSWAALSIEAIYTNAGAGSGDVVLRGDTMSRPSGSTVVAPNPSGEIVSVAPSTNVIRTVTLVASVPIIDDETVLINVIRLGGSANDTLADDIGLLAIVVRRVA